MTMVGMSPFHPIADLTVRPERSRRALLSGGEAALAPLEGRLRLRSARTDLAMPIPTHRRHSPCSPAARRAMRLNILRRHPHAARLAQHMAAGRQAVADRDPVVEDEAVALPAATLLGHLLQIGEGAD